MDEGGLLIITVITVCYNSEKTIKRTIESVLKQKYKRIEYIFIDGNSVDKTNSIIEEYRERFESEGIKYKHISEPDNGIFDAMNKGISYATGDWVNYLNSDDEYVDENVLGDVAASLSDEYDCIYGDTINVLCENSFYRHSFDIDALTYRNPYVHQALFCKTKILRQYSFNDVYQYAADFDQAVRMYMDNVRFKHINTPICRFSLEGRSQKNNMYAVREFEVIRKENGIAARNFIKRYLLYLAVILIKGNNSIYKAYVLLKGWKIVG